MATRPVETKNLTLRVNNVVMLVFAVALAFFGAAAALIYALVKF